jgi:hypothetical protein
VRAKKGVEAVAAGGALQRSHAECIEDGEAVSEGVVEDGHLTNNY